MYTGTMIDDLIKAVKNAEQAAKTKKTNSKSAQGMEMPSFLCSMNSTQVQLGVA
ncbi:MAG TPA: hypothetical protein VD837_05685 [Terriglobales bacterium]|nr:hypothetical protein [Terriglobales bacterium]